jgi:hypothetical protein
VDEARSLCVSGIYEVHDAYAFLAALHFLERVYPLGGRHHFHIRSRSVQEDGPVAHEPHPFGVVSSVQPECPRRGSTAVGATDHGQG